MSTNDMLRDVITEIDEISNRLLQLKAELLRISGDRMDDGFNNSTEYSLYQCSDLASEMIEGAAESASYTRALPSNTEFPFSIMKVGESFQVITTSTSELYRRLNSRIYRQVRMKFKRVNHGKSNDGVNNIYEIVRIA